MIEEEFSKMSEKISLEERVARARAAQKQFEFATQEQAVLPAAPF